MKTKGWAIIVTALVLSFTILKQSWGGTVSVRKLPTPGGTMVTRAYAVQSEGFVEVAGQVSRFSPLHHPGHVDIFVHGPEGSLLGTAKERLPRIMAQRRGRLDIPFSSRFDFPAPEGTTVFVRYHGTPFRLAEKCWLP